MSLDSADIRKVQQLIDARMKHSRHENDDHLPNALPVNKLTPGTSGYVLGVDATSKTAAWQAPAGQTTWETITERGGGLGYGIGNNAYILGQSTGTFPAVISGAPQLVWGYATNPIFYFDPSSYDIAGRTTQFRVALSQQGNGNAPGVGIILAGLAPVTGYSDAGAGHKITSVRAAGTEGNQAIAQTWNADLTHTWTAASAGIAGGMYVMSAVVSMNAGAFPANFALMMHSQLQYRHV